MTTSILIDTNLLLLARSYHLAKVQSNTAYLELLPKSARKIYEAINVKFDEGNPFYVSEMSVVEMKVVHIRNSIHEFARDVYSMPAGSLYDQRSNILGNLRPTFNKNHLPVVVQDLKDLFDSWGLPEKLRVIPDILSETERITWRRQQEIIFRAVGDYAGFETQDAYIFATALAMEVDEIWTTDSRFRGAIDELRESDFVEYLKRWDGLLFSNVSIPKAQRMKTQ